MYEILKIITVGDTDGGDTAISHHYGLFVVHAPYTSVSYYAYGQKCDQYSQKGNQTSKTDIWVEWVVLYRL